MTSYHIELLEVVTGENGRVFVRYMHQLSEWTSLNGGMPQGTKPDPVIFLAKINDACEDPCVKVYKYVDDLTLLQCRQPGQRRSIQIFVNDLCEWSRENKMNLD